ncbi:MAG: hypothetical protein ACUVRA_01200 [Candidatus Bathyarchaeaceae archaeon]
MKKPIAAYLFPLFLVLALIAPVHASVTMQAIIIDQDVCVNLNLENMNSTIYWKIKENITESTIPNIILENLRQQNLTHVDCYIPKPPAFNDSTSSLQVTFCLYGSDILNFTVNTKSTRRTYYLRTDWRKFQLNVTDEISLDFNKYFGTPVDQWQKINYTLNGKVYPAYYHNVTDQNTFDPLCYFVLPAEATNIQAVKDTIIFELPLSFEDSLLNSPFLILGALIVVVAAFSLYRKVRK